MLPQDSPGGPVVKTLSSNARACGFDSWGAMIPHGSQSKNKNIKQKQYGNKFNKKKNFKSGLYQSVNLLHLTWERISIKQDLLLSCFTYEALLSSSFCGEMRWVPKVGQEGSGRARILTQAVCFGPDSALISTYTSPVTYMVVNLNMFVNIRRLRKSKAEQWFGFGLTKWSSSDGRKEVLSRGPF